MCVVRRGAVTRTTTDGFGVCVLFRVCVGSSWLEVRVAPGVLPRVIKALGALAPRLCLARDPDGGAAAHSASEPTCGSTRLVVGTTVTSVSQWGRYPNVIDTITNTDVVGISYVTIILC